MSAKVGSWCFVPFRGSYGNIQNEAHGTRSETWLGCSLADSSDKHHSTTRKLKVKLWVALIVCIVFMVVELVGGIVANSLAIITDAAHLFVDSSSFGIALFAAHLATKKSSPKYTFGYHRAEVLSALGSVVGIWGLTLVLLYEAAMRIRQPQDVNGKLMFIVAMTGVGVNIIIMLVLGADHHHGHSHGHCHSHGHAHQAHAHTDNSHHSCQHQAHSSSNHMARNACRKPHVSCDDEAIVQHSPDSGTVGGHHNCGNLHLRKHTPCHKGNCHTDAGCGRRPHCQETLGEVMKPQSTCPALAAAMNVQDCPVDQQQRCDSPTPQNRLAGHCHQECHSPSHQHSCTEHCQEQGSTQWGAGASHGAVHYEAHEEGSEVCEAGVDDGHVVLGDGTGVDEQQRLAPQSSSGGVLHRGHRLFHDSAHSSSECEPATVRKAGWRGIFGKKCSAKGRHGYEDVKDGGQLELPLCTVQNGGAGEKLGEHGDEAVVTGDDASAVMLSSASTGGSHGGGCHVGNINLRGAIVHAASDIVQSVGVAVAGGLIWMNQDNPSWRLADPICTFVFAFLVILTTLPLFRDVVAVLMEMVPDGKDTKQLQSDLMQLAGVSCVHDLHVWSLTPQMTMLTAHVHSKPGVPHDTLLEAIHSYVTSQGISHTTIQLLEYSQPCPCVCSTDTTHNALDV